MANSWDVPEREITPESVLKSRRRFLTWAGVGSIAVAGGTGLWWWTQKGADDDVIGAGIVDAQDGELYPAKLNPQFRDLDRALTDRAEAARYCNFYEFSMNKDVWRSVGPFQPTPWTIEVSGLVAKPQTFDLDDLLYSFALEERRYRHRCVETWAMAVPWTGFPLAELVRKVEPLANAKYLRFVTFQRPEQASRQRYKFEPWPYTEGLTLAEATNELAFLATGIYGHPLLRQHGAPIRLVVPWKYGFKSAKSIERIEFTDKQPPTFWNTMAPREYGFEANVNPDQPHPRWSQATEKMLGTGERRPTQIYNGYGEWVGKLYS
jgi:sulfoxide reductase catalytic subunit YedY